MDPVELIDTADVPGGAQLLLLKCGTEFSIEYGLEELMGSRDHLSEQALATLCHQRLAGAEGAVLIGGLGMGFTLGAALAAWGPKSTFVVAELVPQIVDWARGPLAHLFGTSMTDPRVSIKIEDVHDVIEEADGAFDAILLDVDNGPEGFIQLANERIYCDWGLRSAYSALRPGGVLAVWSAYFDAAFSKRLRDAGFDVDVVTLPAFAGSEDQWHSIWFATRPPAQA